MNLETFPQLLLQHAQKRGDRAAMREKAAELVRVHPDTIRKWACAKHPDDRGRPLLPRFKRRGRERTYLAGHVLEAAAVVRRAQHTNCGTSVRFWQARR